MTVTARAAPPGFLAEIGARIEARLTTLLEADRVRWSANSERITLWFSA